MKLKYWAMSLLACGGMLACTNEDVTGENNGQGEGTEVSYLAVNIMNAGGPMTRALPGDYEEGSTEENAITAMRFYLFKADGSAYTLSGKGTNRVTATYSEDEKADQTTSTVEEVGNAVLVIDGSTDTPPASIVAILNYNPGQGTDVFANIPLTQLKAVKDDYATGKTSSGTFLMSNSVYNNGTTAGEVSVAGKLTTNKDEALANPVNIYVERVVAKVKVSLSDTDENGPENSYCVSGTSGDAKAIYAQVKGWQVADYKDESYILKHIDSSWDNTTLGINPWSSNDYHRSFWATSTTGAVTSSFSWSEIETAGMLTQVYTQENTPTDVVADLKNNDLTKVIVAVQLVDEDGTPKPRYQYAGLEYASEDAILALIAPNFSGYYIKTNTDEYTPISSSELKFVKGSEVNGDSYRAYAQLADEFEKAMTDEKENLYTKNAQGGYDEVTDKSTINTDLKKYYAQIWTEGRCYYYTTIPHLATLGVGQYGVVRNHVYQITINGISGFGTPVYDPTPDDSSDDEDIDPETPTDDASYLAAKVNILAWRIVSKEVTLN